MMLVRSRRRMRATGIAGKFVTFAGAMVLCGLSASLSAQPVQKDYPNRRVRIIVPFAAGGPPNSAFNQNVPYDPVRDFTPVTQYEIVASTPEEFAKFVAQDVAFMRDLARKIETSAK